MIYAFVFLRPIFSNQLKHLLIHLMILTTRFLSYTIHQITHISYKIPLRSSLSNFLHVLLLHWFLISLSIRVVLIFFAKTTFPMTCFFSLFLCYFFVELVFHTRIIEYISWLIGRNYSIILLLMHMGLSVRSGAERPSAKSFTRY